MRFRKKSAAVVQPTQTATSERERLEALGTSFLANKISAAGLSYLVTEKTRLRRHLWLVGVIGCIAIMGYMTVNVILEYLQYPKMLIVEDVIMPKIPFPAVTICSLNPISDINVERTSLRDHLKLKQFINKTPALAPRKKLRRLCDREPLCKWSWFLESCECLDNPCFSEFCLPSNDTHCMCSSTICQNKNFECFDLNATAESWTKNLCMCDSTVIYESPVEQAEKINITDILSKIDDEELKTMLQVVWNAKTFDLNDVEEALLPSMDEIFHYGITFDSLVASCSFENNFCNRDNFTILYHPTYGKCYMFNYAGKSACSTTKPLATYNYGSNSGLKLLLRVSDHDEILDLVRREVGARIIIHDPHQIPFVDEYGVNVKPYDMTAVAVSMSTMARLPAPWGNCVNRKTSGLDKEPYSILGCEKHCGFNYMTRKCNCTMRHLMQGTVLSSNKTRYPICDLKDSTKMNCVYKALEELEKRMFYCNCKPPCNETIYKYSVTSSELNDDFFRTVKAVRTLSITPDGNLTYIKADERKTMLGVKVYYNTLQVSQQSEVQSYSWETLIANVGGNLGFFMGLTLITFLEIIEFLYDLFSTVCTPQKENKVYNVPNTSETYQLSQVKNSQKATPRRQSI